MQRYVDDIVTLPDKEIFDAMIWIMSRCKLVVEGAAAAPVAALLHGLIKAPAGSKVVCGAERRERKPGPAQRVEVELALAFVH